MSPYYPPTARPGGGSSNSAGLAGTGAFYILNSGNSTFPNSLVIKAGSSVTLASDATAVYISATTNAGGGSATNTFAAFPGRFNLNNYKYVSAYSGLVGAGTLVLYTVPSGKLAIVESQFVFNSNSTAGVSCGIGTKSNNAFYLLAGSFSVTANANNSIANLGYIYGENESLSFTVSTGGFLSFTASIFEFDTSVNVKSIRLFSLSSGNNTIYTCPATSISLILNNPLDTFTSSVFHYLNYTATNNIINFFVVKSGNSPGISYQVTGSASITANTKLNTQSAYVLSGGDFVSIFSGSNGISQISWVNVYES